MTAQSITGSNAGPVVNNLPPLTVPPVSNIWKEWIIQMTLSPASVAANTSAEQTFNQPGVGLLVGDFVDVNKPTAQAGLGIVGMRVSATDTVAITFGNFTASPIVPTASQVYTIFVARPLPAGDQSAVNI